MWLPFSCPRRDTHNSGEEVEKPLSHPAILAISPPQTSLVFCSAPAWRDVVLQPREHLAVPELAVARLEHPVALVREVHETRLHPLPLQRREKLDPLAYRHAEV